MIIDTEKDSGIWISFEGEGDQRGFLITWRGLESTSDMVNGLSACINSHFKACDPPATYGYTSYFYGRIMDAVSAYSEKDPQHGFLKLMPKEESEE